MSHPTPNAEQVKYWDEDAGPRWVAVQERADRQLAPFGVATMEAAGLRDGASVLDVGAGCGDSTIELARRVGATGRVHAVDVSGPMLDLARRRVARAELANVSFQLGDAQVAPIEHAPHDVVFSRFGVMFFDDPPVAFTRLREASRPGGRLAFCCWRSKDENAWISGPTRLAMRFLDLPVPQDPHAPGPFGLFDRARLLGILAAAGWSDARVEPVDRTMLLGGGGGVDEAFDFMARLGPIGAALPTASPEARANVEAALREFFSQHLQPQGVVMNGAIWVVTARA